MILMGSENRRITQTSENHAGLPLRIAIIGNEYPIFGYTQMMPPLQNLESLAKSKPGCIRWYHDIMLFPSKTSQLEVTDLKPALLTKEPFMQQIQGLLATFRRSEEMVM